MAQVSSLPDGRIPSEFLHDEILPPILKEYESFAKALENQLEFYKKEHESLQSDLTTVLNENQQLAVQLQELLKAKFKQESHGSPRHLKDTDMVSNLQQQLSLTMQEKNSALELWKTALLEVESLEEELHTCQNNKQEEVARKELDEVKHEYSTAITMLDERLEEVLQQVTKEQKFKAEVEKQLCQVVEDNQKLANSLRERDEQLEEALKDHNAALEKVQAVEKEDAILAVEVTKLLESRTELEKALEKCHERIKDLVMRDQEAMANVHEALSIVDTAIMEKDMALIAETRAAEENARLQKVIANLIEEAGVKVKEEVDQVKKQFNGQIEVLLNDMKKLQMDLNVKSTQLEKMTRDSKILEDELKRAVNESKEKEVPHVTFLEKNLENVYTEMSKIEKVNFELISERDRLLAKIQQMQESQQMELKQNILEKQLLEEQLNKVSFQFSKSSETELAAAAQIEILMQQVSSLRQELDSARMSTGNDKLGWMKYQRQMHEHQQMIEQIRQVQKKGVEMAQELQQHLKSQVDVKHKWQNEFRSLTKKFEERIQTFRAQLSQVKKSNQQLEQELSIVHSELEYHQKECNLKLRHV